jgi:hypothetical protein
MGVLYSMYSGAWEKLFMKKTMKNLYQTPFKGILNLKHTDPPEKFKSDEK